MSTDSNYYGHQFSTGHRILSQARDFVLSQKDNRFR